MVDDVDLLFSSERPPVAEDSWSAVCYVTSGEVNAV